MFCLTYLYLLIAMAIYKIKSEDKAALLNRLEKLGVKVSSNDLKNKTELKGEEVVSYFELNTDDPNLIQKIDSILNQSPAINQLSDMENKKKKMTKDELKEMVRQELQSILAEKKKVKGEEKKAKLDEATLEESPIVDILGVLSGVAGIGLGSAAIAKAQDMLKAKNPELYKKLQSVSSTIVKADPSKDLKETEQLNEIDPAVMDAIQGIGGFAALAGTAFGIARAGVSAAKKELVKKFQSAGKEIPDDKTLEKLAAQAFRGAMDKATGAGMGADTPDVNI